MIKTFATCCLISLVGTLTLHATAHAQESEPEAETLEQELQAARDRLDEAARELARLAAQAPGMTALLEQSMGWSGRTMLGLSLAPAESPTASDGARVAGVTPDGPAAQAGVRAGDVIEAIDGQSLAVADGSRPSRRLNELLRGVQPGQEVTLRVRREGDLQDITVTAQAAGAGVLESLRGILPRDWSVPEDWRDAPRRWSAAVRAGSGPWGQLEMVSMTPGLGEYFGTDQGLLVLRVAEGSALPLRDGDVLLAIGGREPSSPEHALRILASYEPGESVDLEVMRRKRREQLLLTVPASTPAPGTEN
ncbi:MAG: PDZ domain-containing protein [Gammaproteobacteria bacterium]|nr:MAG: PDZ domain-containing protein [Gammaproteobacteria bacterium]